MRQFLIRGPSSVVCGLHNYFLHFSITLGRSVLKEYLVPQKASFDQLLFKKAENKISVVVNRFAQDGAKVKNAYLFDFPVGMTLEDILVTRSADRTNRSCRRCTTGRPADRCDENRHHGLFLPNG